MTSNGLSHYQPMIRDLPQGERPRERLREFGSKPLSNTELIAILLRTGMKGENVLSLSSRLLADFGGLAGLGRATFAELCAARGLSEAKACHLLAELELGRRFISVQQSPAKSQYGLLAPRGQACRTSTPAGQSRCRTRHSARPAHNR